MADIEIRHLSALAAVAETGTFARAAEQLGYTQSAVSQQIAALERAVGGSVFDRPGGPRRVELTPTGSLLLDAAGDVLERLSSLQHDLEQMRAGEVGRVVVGTFQSVSVGILPRVVERLRAESPDIEIGLFESDDDDELLGRLAAGELDLSFVVPKRVPDGVEIQELARDPWVIVAPGGRTGSHIVTMDELASSPMVGQPTTSCQLLVDNELATRGVVPGYVFRTSDNSAVQAMVRAGVGMAVMPLLAVDLDDPDVSFCEMDPPLTDRVIAVARSARRTLCPAAMRFIEIAIEECDVVERRRECFQDRMATQLDQK